MKLLGGGGAQIRLLYCKDKKGKELVALQAVPCLVYPCAILIPQFVPEVQC